MRMPILASVGTLIRHPAVIEESLMGKKPRVSGVARFAALRRRNLIGRLPGVFSVRAALFPYSPALPSGQIQLG